EWAAHAALGWIGRNTLVLERGTGSYFFLAELLTDLQGGAVPPAADHFGGCTPRLPARPPRAPPPPRHTPGPRPGPPPPPPPLPSPSRPGVPSRRPPARRWRTGSSAATSARRSVPGTATRTTPSLKRSSRLTSPS